MRHSDCIQKCENLSVEMFEKGKIKSVILDFDGVIVESNGIKDKVFRQIFSLFPEHSDDFWEYHQKHISVSRFAKFDYVLEKIGKPGNDVLKSELLRAFSKETLVQMKCVPFVTGAIEFLEKFANRIPLYLASVTPIEDLMAILDNLQVRSLFTEVYGCPPWNKPDAIRDILKNENIEPINAVLIGDSYGDQRAAAETGIHFIGRNSGLGFENPQPKIIISDLSILATILQID